MVTVNEYLQFVVEKGGSDLHLTCGIPPAIRVNGELVAMQTAPLKPVGGPVDVEGGWFDAGWWAGLSFRLSI